MAKQMRKVPREAVEQVAKVFGKDSGAAKALAAAETHDGPVQFFQCGSAILVEKSSPAIVN